MFKLATWNVNSIRIRFPLLQKLTTEKDLDVICLQEVKAKEEDFPFSEIENLGYKHIALYSMPAYNGVAILSKIPLTKIEKHIHTNRDDARHISAMLENGVEIHNIYIPAGGEIPDTKTNPSFVHKLNFVDELGSFFSDQSSKRLICGDFNIAPLENDVWNHKAMLKTISHTPIEIEKLAAFFKNGNFVDVARRIYPEPQKLYSWWSYRNPNWQKNDKGRRLDHIWITPDLTETISDIEFCRNFRAEDRPSDHIPLIVTLKI